MTARAINTNIFI